MTGEPLGLGVLCAGAVGRMSRHGARRPVDRFRDRKPALVQGPIPRVRTALTRVNDRAALGVRRIGVVHDGRTTCRNDRAGRVSPIEWRGGRADNRCPRRT